MAVFAPIPRVLFSVRVGQDGLGMTAVRISMNVSRIPASTTPPVLTYRAITSVSVTVVILAITVN
jgi:hypothetical protein